ncbi:hypothetical protein M436DRAFT_66052 [Aureobasidium namibiae CBS 147.97]|uniref:Uncharacterized protein n=1 Tax=Aureobasidium namibiae CBS 147.97 TaxID=1043004 RepID=A0A074WLK6_9PEZI|nr:uncharacterized protein M436DRAFT_66052 [Aureobasidium namibiae CBS 147.97]KEQ70642.1 hypothetical protein M436DRAFT_66052 [Aureobasidium namibiae CBS 147.97]
MCYKTARHSDGMSIACRMHPGQSIARSTFCRDSTIYSRICQSQLLRLFKVVGVGRATCAGNSKTRMMYGASADTGSATMCQPTGTADGACGQAKYLPEASSFQLQPDTDPKLNIQYKYLEVSRGQTTTYQSRWHKQAPTLKSADPRVTIGNRSCLTCRLPGPPSRPGLRYNCHADVLRASAARTSEKAGSVWLAAFMPDSARADHGIQNSRPISPLKGDPVHAYVSLLERVYQNSS